MRPYLSASELLDADHPIVRETAQELTARCEGAAEKLATIYRYVRDIPYDILNSFRYLAAGKRRASDALIAGHAFCMGKASVFVSLCRAVDIPARIAFQHLHCPDKAFMSEEVRQLWNDRPLPWHSLGEAYFEGRWIKLDATIPADVASEKGRPYLRDFDGVNDIATVEGAIVAEIGSFADYPADVAQWYEQMAREVVAAVDCSIAAQSATEDDGFWSGPDAQTVKSAVLDVCPGGA